MTNVMIKIGMGILQKLVTERFISRMVVIGLKNLSKSTTNKIDDEVAESVDEALGRPCDQAI